MARRQDVLRWAAPVAFLAGLTIAVLLIRAGLHSGGGATLPTVAVPTATAPAPTAATTAGRTTTGKAAARYVSVQAGDTFGSIAAKSGTSVQQLERLNPGVSSNALTVGEKIRVK